MNQKESRIIVENTYKAKTQSRQISGAQTAKQSPVSKNQKAISVFIDFLFIFFLFIFRSPPFGNRTGHPRKKSSGCI